MITGRFEFAGIRRFSKLPKGALFVESDLRSWHTYWVEEGRLVYGPHEGQEEPVYRKEKRDEKHVAVPLNEEEEEEVGGWIGPDSWVTQLEEAEGKKRVWIERKISVHVVTFAQLSEGGAFISVGGCSGSLEGFNSHSPSTPSIYRRKGEIGVRLDGDGEREISPLERVIPVAVGDIRAPEYVLIRIRKKGPHSRLYPTKRSRVAEHPEHYEIVEEGFPDRISAAERARKLWSERPTK